MRFAVVTNANAANLCRISANTRLTAALYSTALFTSDTVTISVQTIDVRSDYSYRPSHIGWTISTTACAVDVTGDWDTRSIVWITTLGPCGRRHS